jgi:hypothetical protein
LLLFNFAGVFADKGFHGLNESGASLVVEIGGGGSWPGADSSVSSRCFISFTDARSRAVSCKLVLVCDNAV